MTLPDTIKKLVRKLHPVTSDEVLAAFMAEPSLTPKGFRFDTEYVVGFAFDADLKEVALIRKKTPEWQAGLLNGLGGHVDEGETPEQAMVREFYEEGGVETNVDHWVYFMDKIGSRDQAKPGQIKTYRVRCYCTILAELPIEREIVEGHIVRLPVMFANPERSDMLDNVPFTIALARCVLAGGKPVHTTAVY